MIRRILVNLKQRKIYLLLFILFTTLIAFVYFALTIYTAAVNLNEDTFYQLGSRITVSVNSSYYEEQFEEYISSESEENFEFTYETMDTSVFEDILNITGVAGINSIDTIDLSPINFENSKEYQGENPYEQTYVSMFSDEDLEIYSNAINAVGCIDTQLYDYFRKNLSTLILGEYPSETNQGALISETLASENNLSVGDYLEVSILERDLISNNTSAYYELTNSEETYSIKVVGIYSTSLYFNITENNDSGTEIFKNSPYNTIFLDYTTIKNIQEEDYQIKSFDVYLTSPTYTESVLNEINGIYLDESMYEAYDATQMYNSELIGIITDFKFSILSILLIASIGGLILFLIVLLSLNMYDEIKILYLLGEQKSKILKQKVLEYSIVAIISTPIAILIAYNIALATVGALNPEITLESIGIASFLVGDDFFMPNLTIVFEWKDVLYTLAYAVLLIVTAILVSTFKIFRIKGKNFYNNEE